MRLFFTIAASFLGILFAAIFPAKLFNRDSVCTLDHALVSVYAVRTSSGEVIIDQNSDISLTPASCLKIATTAAALCLLGPDQKFETCLEYVGILDEEKKTLKGNIIIRGGGDPCLGSDRIAGSLSWKDQIDRWANEIQKLGIHEISGKIIGDASKWESALAVPSWSWEDLGNYYGAGACALTFNENCYSLFLKPGRTPGGKAGILRTDPPLSTLLLHNEVQTGSAGSGDGAYIYGCELANVQRICGTIPAGVDAFVIKGAIPNPSQTCAHLLTLRLREKGIAIKEQELAQTGKGVCICTAYSPAIKEIVHECNRKSVNLYAEHLLKKMGERVLKEGSTLAGIQAVRDFWESQGVDLQGFQMADGSGLSRKNLITTKQLVSILLKMRQSEHFPVFFNSLPAEEGLMRAKSGSMSQIKGYAGYTGDIAFAIIINHAVDAKAMKREIKCALSRLNQLASSNSTYPH